MDELDELFGFLSVDELAGAIAAWREMEGRARFVHDRDEKVPYIMWILDPVDVLDRAAGMKAIGEPNE